MLRKRKGIILTACFVLIILIGVCSSILCYRLGISRCSVWAHAHATIIDTKALSMIRDGKTDEAIQHLEGHLDGMIPGLQRQTRVQRLALLRQGALSSAKDYIAKYDTQFNDRTLAVIMEAKGDYTYQRKLKSRLKGGNEMTDIIEIVTALLILIAVILIALICCRIPGRLEDIRKAIEQLGKQAKV